MAKNGEAKADAAAGTDSRAAPLLRFFAATSIPLAPLYLGLRPTFPTPPDLQRFLEWVVLFGVTLLVWRHSSRMLIRWSQSDNQNERRKWVTPLKIFLFVLAFLGAVDLLRSRVPQPLFVLLLSGLALDGIAVGAAERVRPKLMMVTAVGSALCIALHSVFVVMPFISWQAAVGALGLSAIGASSRVGWSSAAMKDDAVGKVERRALAVLFLVPQACTGLLALLGQLPPWFMACYLLLPLYPRVTKELESQVKPETAYSISEVGSLLLVVLVGCVAVQVMVGQ